MKHLTFGTVGLAVIFVAIRRGMFGPRPQSATQARTLDERDVLNGDLYAD